MRPIDADKLILSLRKCAEDEHSKRASTTWADAFEDFIDIIENAPTVEAAPVVHARWIKNEDRVGWRCSKCVTDDIFAYVWDDRIEREVFQDFYCPNCGAKMEDSNE